MSSASKAIKKIGKKILKVAAIGAVLFATGGMAAAAMGGTSLAAGAASGLATGAGLVSSAGGAIAAGAGKIGAAIGGMSPVAQGALIQTGGAMLQGAMTPTEAEQYTDLHDAKMASFQAPASIYSSGNEQAAGGGMIQSPQSSPMMAQQANNAVAPQQSGSMVRYDPIAGKFVS